MMQALADRILTGAVNTTELLNLLNGTNGLMSQVQTQCDTLQSEITRMYQDFPLQAVEVGYTRTESNTAFATHQTCRANEASRASAASLCEKEVTDKKAALDDACGAHALLQ